MKNPIFIVGLPRSGSTLWHNIFAKKSSICRMGEMHYLTPVRKDFRYFIKDSVGDLKQDDNIRKMFDLIFSGQRGKGITEGFWTSDIVGDEDSKLKEALINRVMESDRSLESIYKIILEEYAAYKGKSRCCVKFPVYPSFIPELMEWYPDCKVVHITRDPRAMAISRKNDPAGTRKKIQKYPYLAFFIKRIMVLFVVFQYMWSSRLHRKFQKKYDNYQLFIYEDLLANPQSTIERLCHHTGVDYSEEMLNPDKGQASSITDKKREGFDKTAAFRWKSHITKFEYWMITSLTRSGMKRFEYDPEKYE